MKSTSLTIKTALLMAGGEKFSLLNFYENGRGQQVFLFAHTHNLISYLKDPFFKVTYHRIELCCHICKYTPDYAPYGYANMYLMHNNINEKEFVTWNKEKGCFMTVKNEPRYRRFICLCPDHINNCIKFNNSKTNQLQLF